MPQKALPIGYSVLPGVQGRLEKRFLVAIERIIPVGHESIDGPPDRGAVLSDDGLPVDHATPGATLAQGNVGCALRRTVHPIR